MTDHIGAEHTGGPVCPHIEHFVAAPKFFRIQFLDGRPDLKVGCCEECYEFGPPEIRQVNARRAAY